MFEIIEKKYLVVWKKSIKKNIYQSNELWYKSVGKEKIKTPKNVCKEKTIGLLQVTHINLINHLYYISWVEWYETVSYDITLNNCKPQD